MISIDFCEWKAKVAMIHVAYVNAHKAKTLLYN